MKIVVLDGYTLNPGDLSWEELKRLGEVEIHDRTPKEKVIERCKEADIVLTNKTPVSKEAISQLPSLKYIGVLATGYNIVDIEAAKNYGVIVSNVPGYGAMSVAQLTFALLLELCHHVQRHSDAVMNGKWTKSPDFSFSDYPLIELAGKTIGIIGLGDIGQKVADIATAFGMKVIAFSRTQTDQSHRGNFRWVTKAQLFEEADVVSLHCPLTPHTEGIINRESLNSMKRSAFLLNTSRGPLIVEQDLADALNNGTIAGAGVDVLSTEPPLATNPLFGAKNCIITPHIAWATKEARERLMRMTLDNIVAFQNGTPENVVNGFNPSGNTQFR
jgi:glycerate dehydrogenase